MFRLSARDDRLGLAGTLLGVSDATPGADAVTELLGMLAYGELLAFDRMASDARLAPDLTRRAIFSEMAAAEIVNYRRIADRLRQQGVDPERAMAPFHAALLDYHDQTEPGDWLEALTKAYVGDGVADDFFREVAAFLSGDDRHLILGVLHDEEATQFAIGEIRTAISTDPAVAHRLSMWARRLLGEGISQAQRVVADRPALVELIITGTGDLVSLTGLMQRLTSAHAARMATLGLNN